MQTQLIQAAALALTLSLDALAVSFAYGCKNIKIPPTSALIINIICTTAIALAFLIGTSVAEFFPHQAAIIISFSILLIIGIIKLLDSITKSIIRKYTQINKEIKLSILNFKLILQVYADPEIADIDISRSIEPRESVTLAISIALDGFVVGFGAALLGFNAVAVILFSLLTNGAAILAGSKLGNKTATTAPFNVSWLAGVILIALAFTQLF